jgi:hypothetical protein
MPKHKQAIPRIAVITFNEQAYKDKPEASLGHFLLLLDYWQRAHGLKKYCIDEEIGVFDLNEELEDAPSYLHEEYRTAVPTWIKHEWVAPIDDVEHVYYAGKPAYYICTQFVYFVLGDSVFQHLYDWREIIDAAQDIDEEDHTGCPMFPQCDLAPHGCVLFSGSDVELYGHH